MAHPTRSLIYRLPSIWGTFMGCKVATLVGFTPHRRLQLSAYLGRLGGCLTPSSVARVFHSKISAAQVGLFPTHPLWSSPNAPNTIIFFSINGEIPGCLPQLTLVGPGYLAPCFELISTHNRLYEIEGIITTCSQI